MWRSVKRTLVGANNIWKNVLQILVTILVAHVLMLGCNHNWTCLCWRSLYIFTEAPSRGRLYIPHGQGEEKTFRPHVQNLHVKYTELVAFCFVVFVFDNFSKCYKTFLRKVDLSAQCGDEFWGNPFHFCFQQPQVFRQESDRVKLGLWSKKTFSGEQSPLN